MLEIEDFLLAEAFDIVVVSGGKVAMISSPQPEESPTNTETLTETSIDTETSAETEPPPATSDTGLHDSVPPSQTSTKLQPGCQHMETPYWLLFSIIPVIRRSS